MEFECGGEITLELVTHINELQHKLKVAVEFIQSVPDAHEHYGHELKSMCDDIIERIKAK
jgi:hypothetical protein